MLADRPDVGSEAFMASRMGVGMFVFDVATGGGTSRWMLHQAANDGFRGVLLVCFDGPDAAAGPRGFVLLANRELGDTVVTAFTLGCGRALSLNPQ